MIGYNSPEAKILRNLDWSVQALRAFWFSALNDSHMEWADWAKAEFSSLHHDDPHVLSLRMVHAALEGEMTVARECWDALLSLSVENRTGPYCLAAQELAAELKFQLPQ